MPKPNAYSCFVNEVANKRRAEGQTRVIVANLFRELGPTWKALSEDEKQRYKDKAKQVGETWTKPKKKPNQTPTDGLQPSASMTSSTDKIVFKTDGTNLNHSTVDLKPKNIIDCKLDIKASLKRPHEDEKPTAAPEPKKKPGIPNWKNIKHSKTPIDPLLYMDMFKYRLRQSSDDIIANRGREMITMPIYTISINVLCKQKRDCPDQFVPLEISIYAYSLKKGVVAEPYHVLIDAGPVPINCLNEANDHALNHKITFPPNKNGYPQSARKDYKKIYKELLKYVNDGERTVLIQDTRDMHQIKSSLEWLHNKAMEEPGTKLAGISTWTILPIVEFVGSMYIGAHIQLGLGEMATFGLYYKLHMMMEASVMDYNVALMCDYHAQEENISQWCAKACATKMIINMEDFLHRITQLYDTPMIEGIPASYETPDMEALASVLRIERKQLPSTNQGAATLDGQQHLPLPPSQPEMTSPIIPETVMMDCQPYVDKDSVLAIEAPPVPSVPTQAAPQMNPLDPRLRCGRLTPAENAKPTLSNPYGPHIIDPEPENVPEPKAPKKPKEQLIIASSGIIYEHPPDIY